MNRQDSLLPLFFHCLNGDYIHTSEGGDYALQIDGARLYLLFEWSDGSEDWHHNLTFSAQKVNPEEPKSEQWHAHRGFLKVWNAMKPEIIRRIANLTAVTSIQRITCVGYSHGAALALLATEDLSRRFGESPTVEGYGFGSPRVVWGKLPDNVRRRLKNFHTIRNIPDLVTHLPPAIFGFRHINLMSVGQKGKYSPIEAHTSQAYIAELSEIRLSAPSIPSTPRILRERE